MTKTWLSVVIPVHNGERYLAAAIESVLMQSVWAQSVWAQSVFQTRESALQIVVIDDGSTDETERVARSFASVEHANREYANIEYSKQAQSGAAAARNAGVAKARGEFLAFLDADDLWEPRKIERQMAAIELSQNASPQNASPLMVFGQVQQFFSADLDAATRSATRLTDEVLPAYHPGAMLLRRDDFRRVGDFGTTWEIGEFLDWYGRAVELGFRAQMLPEIVMLRRLHANNQGLTKRDFHRDYARILKAALDRRRANAKISLSPNA